jgi:hypothetical protein
MILSGGMRVVFALMLVAVTTPAASRADPIRIRSGWISFDTGDPPLFRLEGDNFLLEGGGSGENFRTPFDDCRSCLPGALIDMGAVFGGASGQFNLGTGTINGIRYGTAIENTVLAGTFLVEAPTVPVPPSTAGHIILTRPFVFQGDVALFPGGNSGGGTPIFASTLQGTGVAKVELELARPGQPDAGSYHFFDYFLRFEESPSVIPEPATGLLLSGGLIVGWFVRRCHQSRRPPGVLRARGRLIQTPIRR